MKENHHCNKDLFNKYTFKKLPNRAHKFIGGNGDFKYFLPYELVTNDNEHHYYTDIPYMSSDGFIYDVEPQSGRCSEDDLHRFNNYSSIFEAMFHHGVVTIVISSGNPKYVVRRCWVTKTKCIKPIFIFLKLMDGQKYLNKINNKTKNNIELDYTEPIELVYIPQMDLKNRDVVEVVTEICYLIRDDETMSPELKEIVSRCFRFMIFEYVNDKKTKKELLEALNLQYGRDALDNSIDLENEEYIAILMDESKSDGFSSGFTEGKTEGRNEGINEGRNEAFILVARNMLESGYNEDEVHRLTGLHFTDIINQ